MEAVVDRNTEVLLDSLFRDYERLAALADQAFETMQRDYGDLIKCQRRCTDCCYAVFGLFPVEAVYLKCQFERLDGAGKEEILLRTAQTEADLQRLQERLARFDGEPGIQNRMLARERIRCPLLNGEEECALYPHRPITCRVYGIPVAVHGQGRVCWKAGFANGEAYPTFNLDAVYKELYRLSRVLLEETGAKEPEKAALLLSVAKALKTPLVDLVRGEWA
jgi:Fe-S-cluster containining protein